MKKLSFDEALETYGYHLLFSDVNRDSVAKACEFILKANLTRKPSEPITIVLNTGGGDCSDGFALIDFISTSKIPVSIIGTGDVKSMGVLILSAGTPGLRNITENTEVMAHQFIAEFSGKHHEILAMNASLKELENKFIAHFLKTTKMSEKQIRDVLLGSSDRFLSPKECLKYGIVDRVIQGFDSLVDICHVNVAHSASKK